MARLLLRAGTMTLLLHFALARADAADLSFADAVRRAAGETARSRMVTADADLLKAEARSAAAWTNPEIGARQEPDQGSVDVLVPLDIGAIGRGAVVPDAVKAADVRERAGRAAVGAAGGAAWLDARRATDISQLTRASEALSTRLATAAQGRVASGEWSPDEGASARAAGSAATADLARLDASATVLAAQAEIDIAERLAAAWDIPGLDAALTATVRRYDAGELSLPDYLARRDLAVEAEQNAVDARWRLARARLAAWELAGELPTGSRSTEVSR